MEREKKKTIEKKRLWRILCLLAALYGLWELAGNLAARLLYLFRKDPYLTAGEAASIGIIGGADGPTAVFITTPGWTHWIVPVVLLLVGLAGFLYFSKQHKRSSEGEE